MYLIKPTPITDSIFVSSTEAEDEYAAWASSTVYSVGDKRIYAHRIYECLTAHTSTLITPDELTGGGTPTWADIGPTNQWAMFDDIIGTSTTATDSLTVVLAPGNTSGLALIDLVGDALNVSVTNGLGGTVVYQDTIDLDETVILSPWDYFFAEHQQMDKVAIFDLPIEYLNAHITITLTGTGTISCGVCQPGIVYLLGIAQWPIRASFDEYASKVTDTTTGGVTINPKSDRISLTVDFIVEFETISRVNRVMRDMKRQLAVYVPTDLPGYETYIAYGYAYNYEVDQDNPNVVIGTVEIEEVV